MSRLDFSCRILLSLSRLNGTIVGVVGVVGAAAKPELSVLPSLDARSKLYTLAAELRSGEAERPGPCNLAKALGFSLLAARQTVKQSQLDPHNTSLRITVLLSR